MKKWLAEQWTKFCHARSRARGADAIRYMTAMDYKGAKDALANAAVWARWAGARAPEPAPAPVTPCKLCGYVGPCGWQQPDRRDPALRFP